MTLVKVCLSATRWKLVMPPALETGDFPQRDRVRESAADRKLLCSKRDENEVSNKMNGNGPLGGLSSSANTNNEGLQQVATAIPPNNFADVSGGKEWPLPLIDHSTRLTRLSLIDEWPQQGAPEFPGEDLALGPLHKRLPGSAERREVDRNIKRIATGGFHRRQGSGDLYTKLQHFDNGDTLQRKQHRGNVCSSRIGTCNRYVVTGWGSWGDYSDPLFSQSLPGVGDIKSPTRSPGGTPSIPESDYEILPVSALEGIPLPPGTGGGGGVSGLKEWYKNRTLVSKATSKAEAPPNPKYLRKLVLSSWKHNGAGASGIINLLNKRPLQSSPVIALKALITINKLLQQGSPSCRDACYAKLAMLREISKANMFRNQVGHAAADPYGQFIHAYASLLVEKVSFHHAFPAYESSYSVDFSAITSQPSCSKEAAQDLPRAQALASLQQIQDMILVALEEGFALLRKKCAAAGMKGVSLSGAGGTSGLVGSGESNPIELIVTALIPILREADLVYDICWFLLSSQLSVWEVGRHDPNAVIAAHQMTAKFGTQHKALRNFFEQAKSEAAICCNVTPPNLPLNPPGQGVLPNNGIARFSLGSTGDHETGGTRCNVESGAHLDDVSDNEAELPKSVSWEGKGIVEAGEDTGVRDPHDLQVKKSVHPAVPGRIMPRQEVSGPVLGGVGAAAAAAMQRFAAGQAEARRVAAAAAENMVTSPARLRSIRLEPPPRGLSVNIQLDSGTFFRPERPQHTRGIGRTWSSFDDEAFLHQQLKGPGQPWSPIPKLVSPKFYSPRAPGPSKDVGGMLSPRNYKSPSPVLFGLVGSSQMNNPVSPLRESPPASTFGLESKHCPLPAFGQPIQQQQVQVQADSLGFPKYPELKTNAGQLRLERPETPPMIEMDTPVAEQMPMHIGDQQSGAQERGQTQTMPPPSWRLDGSMSDATAWGDFTTTAQPTGEKEQCCRIEIAMDVPLAADWEIPASEIVLGPKIGQGAFGDVLRGSWQGTDIAVKRLHNNFGASYSQAIEEIRHEVAVIMRLRHPNIILFMGACTVPPEICIVMEFASNGSLFGVLHNPNIAMDMATVVRWASEAARGMNYLHTRNPPVVHRDLKSVNLLVDGDWHIKVSDFGLAMTKQSSYAYTQVGTWGWMAPEVLESAPYNEKADVYSFGVVLWELITRDEPFKGYHPMQIMRAIDRGERPQIPKSCPHLYKRLVADCWHTDPKHRPEFVEILLRLGDISNTLKPMTEYQR